MLMSTHQRALMLILEDVSLKVLFVFMLTKLVA